MAGGGTGQRTLICDGAWGMSWITAISGTTTPTQTRMPLCISVRTVRPHTTADSEFTTIRSHLEQE